MRRLGQAAEGRSSIAVDAPFSRSPYIGQTIARGVELAVSEINQAGLGTNDALYKLKVKRYDNALSPRKALSNVRRAIADGAVAIVDDGTGVDASWEVANKAKVPICITYDGGNGLVDLEQRPNVFRDRADRSRDLVQARRVHDPEGLEAGAHARRHDLRTGGRRRARPGVRQQPRSRRGEARAYRQVRRTCRRRCCAHGAPGATALLVWGQASTIAEVLIAARGAGWDVPVFAPSSAEDPALRQQLANRPEWLDGLTFATGRMTAELGPDFFYAFQSRFESAYGAQKVGVRTSDGKPVVAPPDYAMYSYDCMNVLAQAIRQFGFDERSLERRSSR